MVGDLLGGDPAVAVAVARRDPGEGVEHLAGAELAVAVQVEHAEDCPALVGGRQRQPALRRDGPRRHVVVQLARVELAVTVSVEGAEEAAQGRGLAVVAGQFRLFDVAILIGVRGSELGPEGLAGRVGRPRAVVDVDIEPNQADVDLDHALGELPDLEPARRAAVVAADPGHGTTRGVGREGHVEDRVAWGLREVFAEILGIERAVPAGVGRGECLGRDGELLGRELRVGLAGPLARPGVVLLEQQPDQPRRRLSGDQLDDRRHAGGAGGPAHHLGRHGVGLRDGGRHLVGADQFVVVEVEPAERAGDGRQLGPGDLPVLVAVEVVKKGVGPPVREPVDLDPEWPGRRPDRVGQLLDGDDAVLRLRVDLDPAAAPRGTTGLPGR